MKFVCASIALLSVFTSSIKAESATKNRNLRGRKAKPSLERAHVDLSLSRNLQDNRDNQLVSSMTQLLEGSNDNGLLLYNPNAVDGNGAQAANDRDDGATGSSMSGNGGASDRNSGGGGSKGASEAGGGGSGSKSKGSSSGSRTRCKGASSSSASSYATAYSKYEYEDKKDEDCERLNPNLTANNDVFETPKNTAITKSTRNIVINDYNTAGGDKLVDIYTYPSNGELVLNDDGSFTYTPYEGFVGLDTFDYRLTDGVNDGANVATIGIIVGDVGNLAPMLGDDIFEVTVGIPLTVYASQIRENDFEWDGDRMTITTYSPGPQNGALMKNSDGGFIYTPNTDFVGEDTFEYTVSDGKGGISTASITMIVKQPNMPPVAVDDTLSTDGSNTFEFSPYDLIKNDSDPEGGELSLVDFTEPNKGQGLLTSLPNGEFVYLPQGFNGQTYFTYTISDPDGGTDTATVTLNVAMGNRDPEAADDEYSTPLDTKLKIEAPGLLANDFDLDGDDIYVETATEPQSGKLKKIYADGSFQYKPNYGFQGVDMFTYTVVDGRGGEKTAQVVIEVGGDNKAPRATDDSYQVPMNSDGVDLYVMSNDDDADGDMITIEDYSLPVNGYIKEQKDGYFTYIPNQGFTGEDTYTYDITDGKGGKDTATVTIVVGNDSDEGPVAVDDSFQAYKNTLLTIAAPGILRNDNYQSGDVNVAKTRNPNYGALTMTANGGFTYNPALNYYGVDSFTYTITDASGKTAVAKVTIRVNQSVQPPLINMGGNDGGGGNTIIVGVAGTSSDCLLGFTDCAGVGTASNTITSQYEP